MTTTEVQLIPPDWEAAIEREPGCGVLRSALADHFEEIGAVLAADCIRWTVEKGRWPSDYCQWGYSSASRWALPEVLYWRVYHLAFPENDSVLVRDVTFTHKFSFNRLLTVWQTATDSERAEWWNWNPS